MAIVPAAAQSLAILRYLAQQGILPGGRLHVLERQPFGGPLLVSVDGCEHTLGGGLLRAMRINVKTSVLSEGKA